MKLANTLERPITGAPYVQTQDGTSLFVRDWGQGEPVLFVPSWSMTADLWQFQMADLVQRGYRAISFDKRSHGRSSDPGRGYDLDTLADDLSAVIEALGFKDVVLVGHSMGCSEILRYMRRHGQDRVKKIVLVGTITPYLPLTPKNPEGIDPDLSAQTIDRWRTDLHGWIAENIDPFLMPDSPQSLKDWVCGMVSQTSLLAQIETTRHSFEADLRPDAILVTVPTLIIHGTNDASAPLALTAVKTAELIQDCELKIYQEAPHGIFLTHVEKFNNDLAEFLAR